MGVIAFCVGESIGELVQKFPCYNAVVEYVAVFVDPDLGRVVGIAYWIATSSFFANQLINAARLSEYWSSSGSSYTKVLEPILFYVVAPLCIIFLNFCGVFWYGIVETVGGFLKVILLFSVSIALYVIDSTSKSGIDI
jgi:amino acid transporter